MKNLKRGNNTVERNTTVKNSELVFRVMSLFDSLLTVEKYKFFKGALICLLINLSFSSYSQEVPKLKPVEKPFRLIGEQRLNKTVYVNKTLVGGLSGIDMNPNGLFYVISDDISDRDPSRFYVVDLDYDDKSFNQVIFKDVIFMKIPSGNIFPYKNELITGKDKEIANGESIRYNKETNSLFWTSEGLFPFQKASIQPFVRQMNLQGEFISEISMPEQFRYDSNNDKAGLRANANFESLCLVPNSDDLLVATEAPLIQDGLRPDYYQSGSPVRIARVNWKTNRQIAQYAYVPDKTIIPPLPKSGTSNNSVTELLAIDSTRFLVLERSFSIGHEIAEGNSIRVYEIDLSDAVKIDAGSSLAISSFKPVDKKLVLDFSQLGLKQVDNMEGMCWGKELPNGKKSIVFVTDSNFSDRQISQFFVFEVNPLLL